MPIIMGDARLTVKKQPAQAYDYLLLDAFSSDAIPSHLITKEAVDMFASRVTNEGILAFNTTNRYIDVSPILAKIGEAKGLDVYALYTKEPVERMLEMRTSVAVTAFAMGPASAAALERAGFKKLTPRPSQELWTDHYTNVTAEIIRGKISRMFSP
jgi:spermidine synthase